ncbi:MAG: hypothetical protein HUJ96_10620 [Marinilabiliaceae bacterium]|nr:hypothetical protein [Marinilabiliaceae bacterium]
MADNYLERRMEEHSMSGMNNSRRKNQRKIHPRRVMVVMDSSPAYEAIIRALRNGGHLIVGADEVMIDVVISDKELYEAPRVIIVRDKASGPAGESEREDICRNTILYPTTTGDFTPLVRMIRFLVDNEEIIMKNQTIEVC